MNHDFAETASLLSDPGRAAILMALMDDVALPAGQLAMVANVAPQTASSHLSRLVSGHLLTVEQQGRHRYYRLANPEVAHAVEALMAITPQPPRKKLEEHTPRQANGLEYARSCYSHLAGKLAVAIAAGMQEKSFIVATSEKRFELTKKGCDWFGSLGLSFSDSDIRHPRFARQCLDWTERRHHIGGHLGCALFTRLRELKWIATVRDSRAIRVTHEGQKRFEKDFGIRAL